MRRATFALVVLTTLASAQTPGFGASSATMGGQRVTSHSRTDRNSGRRVVQTIHSWRLGPVVLELGGESTPDQEFATIINAILLRDGRIVIANGGSQELRFFDRSGKLVRRSGRRGSGPGEFQHLSQFFRLSADSLGVYDRNLQRVTIFDPSGQVARTVPVARPSETISVGVPPTVVGAFDDGALVSFAAPPPLPTPGRELKGLYHVIATWFEHTSSGAFSAKLGTSSGGDVFVEVLNGMVVKWDPAFRRELRYVVSGNRLYAGDGGAPRVEVLRSDHKSAAPVTWSPASLTITPNDAARFREERLAHASTPDGRQQLATAFEKTPTPTTMPAYADLRTDGDGNLWIQEYRRPGSETIRWRIFASSGGPLASLEVPANFAITFARDGFVVGIWRNELDVEHVRLYQLTR